MHEFSKKAVKSDMVVAQVCRFSTKSKPSSNIKHSLQHFPSDLCYDWRPIMAYYQQQAVSCCC